MSSENTRRPSFLVSSIPLEQVQKEMLAVSDDNGSGIDSGRNGNNNNRNPGQNNYIPRESVEPRIGQVIRGGRVVDESSNSSGRFNSSSDSSDGNTTNSQTESSSGTESRTVTSSEPVYYDKRFDDLPDSIIRRYSLANSDTSLSLDGSFLSQPVKGNQVGIAVTDNQIQIQNPHLSLPVDNMNLNMNPSESLSKTQTSKNLVKTLTQQDRINEIARVKLAQSEHKKIQNLSDMAREKENTIKEIELKQGFPIDRDDISPSLKVGLEQTKKNLNNITYQSQQKKTVQMLPNPENVEFLTSHELGPSIGISNSRSPNTKQQKQKLQTQNQTQSPSNNIDINYNSNSEREQRVKQERTNVQFMIEAGKKEAEEQAQTKKRREEFLSKGGPLKNVITRGKTYLDRSNSILSLSSISPNQSRSPLGQIQIKMKSPGSVSSLKSLSSSPLQQQIQQKNQNFNSDFNNVNNINNLNSSDTSSTASQTQTDDVDSSDSQNIQGQYSGSRSPKKTNIKGKTLDKIRQSEEKLDRLDPSQINQGFQDLHNLDRDIQKIEAEGQQQLQQSLIQKSQSKESRATCARLGIGAFFGTESIQSMEEINENSKKFKQKNANANGQQSQKVLMKSDTHVELDENDIFMQQTKVRNSVSDGRRKSWLSVLESGGPDHLVKRRSSWQAEITDLKTSIKQSGGDLDDLMNKGDIDSDPVNFNRELWGDDRKKQQMEKEKLKYEDPITLSIKKKQMKQLLEQNQNSNRKKDNQDDFDNISDTRSSDLDGSGGDIQDGNDPRKSLINPNESFAPSSFEIYKNELGDFGASLVMDRARGYRWKKLMYEEGYINDTAILEDPIWREKVYQQQQQQSPKSTKKKTHRTQEELDQITLNFIPMWIRKVFPKNIAHLRLESLFGRAANVGGSEPQLQKLLKVRSEAASKREMLYKYHETGDSHLMARTILRNCTNPCLNLSRRFQMHPIGYNNSSTSMSPVGHTTSPGKQELQQMALLDNANDDGSNKSKEFKEFSVVKALKVFEALLKDKVYSSVKNQEMINKAKNELANMISTAGSNVVMWRGIKYDQLFWPCTNVPQSLPQFVKFYDWLDLPPLSLNTDNKKVSLSAGDWPPLEVTQLEDIRFDLQEEIKIVEIMACYHNILQMPKKYEVLFPDKIFGIEDSFIFRCSYSRLFASLQPYWKSLKYHTAISICDFHSVPFQQKDLGSNNTGSVPQTGFNTPLSIANSPAGNKQALQSTTGPSGHNYLNSAQFKNGIRTRDWSRVFGAILAAELNGMRSAGFSINAESLKYRFFDIILPTVLDLTDSLLDDLSDMQELWLLQFGDVQGGGGMSALMPEQTGSGNQNQQGQNSNSLNGNQGQTQQQNGISNTNSITVTAPGGGTVTGQSASNTANTGTTTNVKQSLQTKAQQQQQQQSQINQANTNTVLGTGSIQMIPSLQGLDRNSAVSAIESDTGFQTGNIDSGNENEYNIESDTENGINANNININSKLSAPNNLLSVGSVVGQVINQRPPGSKARDLVTTEFGNGIHPSHEFEDLNDNNIGTVTPQTQNQQNAQSLPISQKSSVVNVNTNSNQTGAVTASGQGNNVNADAVVTNKDVNENNDGTNSGPQSDQTKEADDNQDDTQQMNESKAQAAFNADLQLFSVLMTKGEFLTSSLLEPEWIQFALMYYDVIEEIFRCYVDFPIIRVKTKDQIMMNNMGNTSSQNNSDGNNNQNSTFNQSQLGALTGGGAGGIAGMVGNLLQVNKNTSNEMSNTNSRQGSKQSSSESQQQPPAPLILSGHMGTSAAALLAAKNQQQQQQADNQQNNNNAFHLGPTAMKELQKGMTITLPNGRREYARAGHMSLASFAQFALDFRLVPNLIDWKSLEWIYHSAVGCEVLSDEQVFKKHRNAQVANNTRFRNGDYVSLVDEDKVMEQVQGQFYANINDPIVQKRYNNNNNQDWLGGSDNSVYSRGPLYPGDIATVIDTKVDMVRVRCLNGNCGFYHESTLVSVVPDRNYWVLKAKMRTQQNVNEQQLRQQVIGSGNGSGTGGNDGNANSAAPQYTAVQAQQVAANDSGKTPKERLLAKYEAEIPRYWLNYPIDPKNDDMTDLQRRAYYILSGIDDWIGRKGMRPRKLYWVFRNPLTHQEFYQGLAFIQLSNMPHLNEFSKICAAMHPACQSEIPLDVLDMLFLKVRASKNEKRRLTTNIFIQSLTWSSGLMELPSMTERDCQSYFSQLYDKLIKLKLTVNSFWDTYGLKKAKSQNQNQGQGQQQKQRKEVLTPEELHKASEAIGISNFSVAQMIAIINRVCNNSDCNITLKDLTALVRLYVEAKIINDKTAEKQQRAYESNPLLISQGLKPISDMDIRQLVMLSDKANEPKVTSKRTMINFDAHAFLECILKIGIFYLQYCSESVQRQMPSKQIWLISYLAFQYQARCQEVDSEHIQGMGDDEEHLQITDDETEAVENLRHEKKMQIVSQSMSLKGGPGGGSSDQEGGGFGIRSQMSQDGGFGSGNIAGSMQLGHGGGGSSGRNGQQRTSAVNDQLLLLGLDLGDMMLENEVDQQQNEEERKKRLMATIKSQKDAEKKLAEQVNGGNNYDINGQLLKEVRQQRRGSQHQMQKNQDSGQGVGAVGKFKKTIMGLGGNSNDRNVSNKSSSKQKSSDSSQSQTVNDVTELHPSIQASIKAGARGSSKLLSVVGNNGSGNENINNNGISSPGPDSRGNSKNQSDQNPNGPTSRSISKEQILSGNVSFDETLPEGINSTLGVRALHRRNSLRNLDNTEKTLIGQDQSVITETLKEREIREKEIAEIREKKELARLQMRRNNQQGNGFNNVISVIAEGDAVGQSMSMSNSQNVNTNHFRKKPSKKERMKQVDAQNAQLFQDRNAMEEALRQFIVGTEEGQQWLKEVGEGNEGGLEEMSMNITNLTSASGSGSSDNNNQNGPMTVKNIPGQGLSSKQKPDTNSVVENPFVTAGNNRTKISTSAATRYKSQKQQKEAQQSAAESDNNATTDESAAAKRWRKLRDARKKNSYMSLYKLVENTFKFVQEKGQVDLLNKDNVNNPFSQIVKDMGLKETTTNKNQMMSPRNWLNQQQNQMNNIDSISSANSATSSSNSTTQTIGNMTKAQQLQIIKELLDHAEQQHGSLNNNDSDIEAQTTQVSTQPVQTHLTHPTSTKHSSKRASYSKERTTAQVVGRPAPDDVDTDVVKKEGNFEYSNDRGSTINRKTVMTQSPKKSKMMSNSSMTPSNSGPGGQNSTNKDVNKSSAIEKLLTHHHATEGRRMSGLSSSKTLLEKDQQLVFESNKFAAFIPSFHRLIKRGILDFHINNPPECYLKPSPIWLERFCGVMRPERKHALDRLEAARQQQLQQEEKQLERERSEQNKTNNATGGGGNSSGGVPKITINQAQDHDNNISTSDNKMGRNTLNTPNSGSAAAAASRKSVNINDIIDGDTNLNDSLEADNQTNNTVNRKQKSRAQAKSNRNIQVTGPIVPQGRKAYNLNQDGSIMGQDHEDDSKGRAANLNTSDHGNSNTNQNSATDGSSANKDSSGNSNSKSTKQRKCQVNSKTARIIDTQNLDVEVVPNKLIGSPGKTPGGAMKVNMNDYSDLDLDNNLNSPNGKNTLPQQAFNSKISVTSALPGASSTLIRAIKQEIQQGKEEQEQTQNLNQQILQQAQGLGGPNSEAGDHHGGDLLQELEDEQLNGPQEEESDPNPPCEVCNYPKNRGWGFLYCHKCADSSYILHQKDFPLILRVCGDFGQEDKIRKGGESIDSRDPDINAIPTGQTLLRSSTANSNSLSTLNTPKAMANTANSTITTNSNAANIITTDNGSANRNRPCFLALKKRCEGKSGTAHLRRPEEQQAQLQQQEAQSGMRRSQLGGAIQKTQDSESQLDQFEISGQISEKDQLPLTDYVSLAEILRHHRYNLLTLKRWSQIGQSHLTKHQMSAANAKRSAEETEAQERLEFDRKVQLEKLAAESKMSAQQLLQQAKGLSQGDNNDGSEVIKGSTKLDTKKDLFGSMAMKQMKSLGSGSSMSLKGGFNPVASITSSTNSNSITNSTNINGNFQNNQNLDAILTPRKTQNLKNQKGLSPVSESHVMNSGNSKTNGTGSAGKKGRSSSFTLANYGNV